MDGDAMIDITIIELTQLVPASVGVLLCLWSVSRTTRSIQILREEGVNGRKLYSGQAARRREASRLGKHLVILLMALYVTEWRITNEIVPNYTFVYATRSLTFTVLSCWMVIETIWEHYDRWMDGQMADHESRRRDKHTSRSTDVASGA